MYLHLRGDDLPEPLLDAFAALTDKSGVGPADVVFDDVAGLVRIPMRRLPLLEQRRTLGNVMDHSHPVATTITIRHVVTCELRDHTGDLSIDEVHVLFGFTIRGREVVMSSVEESRGATAYHLTIRVDRLDIALEDDDP